MKTILTSLIVMIMLSVVSCTKESEEPNSSNENPSDIAKSISVYDQVAISHNLAMDYVGNHQNFDSLTKKQKYEYIQGYSDTHYSFTNDTNWVAHQERMEWGIEIANSPDSASIILLREGLITASQASLVDSLFAIFDDAGNFQNSTYISVSTFNTKVEALEAHINANYSPVFDVVKDEANFAGIMLASCALAKGSFEYWREAATDRNHPWHNYFTTFTYTNGNIPKGLFGNIWHGIKVAAVDVGVFVGSGFGDCNAGTNERAGLLGHIGCMWQHAGAASSGV